MSENQTKMVQLVSENMDKFGSKAKLAADLAALLDGGLLDLSQTRERRAALASERLKLLERFRTLCLAAGVTPPAFETETFQALIPEPDEKLREQAKELASKLFWQHSFPRDSKDEAVRNLLALGRAVELLPCLLSEFGGSRQALLASIDLLRLSLGQEPLGLLNAGDSSDGDSGTRLPEPARELKVLIVDDCVNDIVKTFSALAGGPGLDIGCLFVQIGWNDDRQTALQKTAAAVLAEKPDIVLMDQGMPPINGSDLVRAVDEMMTEQDRIVFVANTGGSPDELNSAGAIGSCRKGDDLSPMRQAIRMLASK